MAQAFENPIQDLPEQIGPLPIHPFFRPYYSTSTTTENNHECSDEISTTNVNDLANESISQPHPSQNPN